MPGHLWCVPEHSFKHSIRTVEKAWVKIANRAIYGDNCDLRPPSDTAQWRSASSFFYASLTDCEATCSASAICKAFVDNHGNDPKYCVFKSSAVSYEVPGKDVYTKASHFHYISHLLLSLWVPHMPNLPNPHLVTFSPTLLA